MTAVVRFLLLALFELIVLGILASLAVAAVNMLLTATGLVGPAALGLSIIAFFAALVLTVVTGTLFLQRQDTAVPLRRRLLEAAAALLLILAATWLALKMLAP